MDSDSTIESFVIKIWLEKSPQASEVAPWHGRITHVATGEYRSIKSMEEIAEFIGAYLGDGRSQWALHRRLQHLIRRFRVVIWKWQRR